MAAKALPPHTPPAILEGLRPPNARFKRQLDHLPWKVATIKGILHYVDANRLHHLRYLGHLHRVRKLRHLGHDSYGTFVTHN